MRDLVNILIVEDDEVDVESLMRLFSKNNIKNPVYCASNGVEALDIIRGVNERERLPKPYVILLDINMPIMNGIELLKHLRGDESLKESVVFILTTSPLSADKITTYKLNVAGYFLKKDMAELVNLLSLYWQLNEFPDTNE